MYHFGAQTYLLNGKPLNFLDPPTDIAVCRQVEVADSAPITAAEVEALEHTLNRAENGYDAICMALLKYPDERPPEFETVRQLLSRLREGDGGQDGDK